MIDRHLRRPETLWIKLKAIYPFIIRVVGVPSDQLQTRMWVRRIDLKGHIFPYRTHIQITCCSCRFVSLGENWGGGSRVIASGLSWGSKWKKKKKKTNVFAESAENSLADAKRKKRKGGRKERSMGRTSWRYLQQEMAMVTMIPSASNLTVPLTIFGPWITKYF